MTPDGTIAERWAAIFPKGLTSFGHGNADQAPKREFCFSCGGHGYCIDFGPTGYSKCLHCGGSGYGESLETIHARRKTENVQKD